jgi:hypothetical protein
VIRPLISPLKLCSEATAKLKFGPGKQDLDGSGPQASCLFKNLRRHLVFRLALESREFKKPRLFPWVEFKSAVSDHIFIRKLGAPYKFLDASSGPEQGTPSLGRLDLASRRETFEKN